MLSLLLLCCLFVTVAGVWRDGFITVGAKLMAATFNLVIDSMTKTLLDVFFFFFFFFFAIPKRGTFCH